MTAISLEKRAGRALSRFPDWSVDAAFALTTGSLIATVLGVGFLNSSNWPTGGDSASHLLYAWLYATELLFSGQVTPWIPEAFGGLPFLSYYFPLPFIVIALLSKVLGVAPAFKWGAFLATMLLPGAVFAFSRRWLGMSWSAAFFGALGALAFLLHEQNSIWGGNLLSTLAGEFAYSYGLLFAVLAMMAWVRAVSLGRGWVSAGVLEAACGYSHGFPLLVVGFSTLFLLLDAGSFARARVTLGLLARGHMLAFCLLGGWLWPMLQMHSLTIPNDASFPLTDWHDLLPKTLWPSFAAGIVGLVFLAVPAVRRCWSGEQARAARYFVGAAGVAAAGFVAGDQLDVADIRFFPLVWLLGAVVCGWLFGQTVAVINTSNGEQRLLGAARALLVAAAGLGLVGWLAQSIRAAPDWSLWNNSGLEAKPQWHNLSRLFPAMSGDLWRPRLLFEHDPANSDIGSTRSLEALPMFLNHRPVLEGLYMESAVLGPAVYQLQSEVSAHPSSPLVRFPSGSLDPEFAARHMEFLHADTLLLRSPKARAAIESSGLFLKVGETLPFSLYRLKQFDSHLAQVVTKPLRLLPAQDWMQDAFAWFRTRSRFEAYQPVYGEPLPPYDSAGSDSAHAVVREKLLSRNELIFETEAVASPHLIKIAYHPRWHLLSKGSLRIAAPGFMLVVPEEREIRLAYEHTLVGRLGMIATISATICVPFFARRRRAVMPYSDAAPAGIALALKRHWLLLCGWAFLAVAGIYFGLHSPERVYNSAWLDMGAKRYAEASARFALAYELRRAPAKKEEALFWLAKSNESAGNRAEAKRRYQELSERYHGYWLPESLYMVAILEREDGRRAETEPYIRRLREEYPGNQWTRKLDEVK